MLGLRNRWIVDKEHLSDSQQLFIYGLICRYWGKLDRNDWKPFHDIALETIKDAIKLLDQGSEAFAKRNDALDSHHRDFDSALDGYNSKPLCKMIQ